ncbi:MAG TPA: hypothetical protein PKL49_07255 [Steroidobacteraceae bacterium]|nr:hypothetical protein [Steroidobacteraceae bacterium]HNS27344.1 hypothetical protein [Steroidobacteraceae bacterium]
MERVFPEQAQVQDLQSLVHRSVQLQQLADDCRQHVSVEGFSLNFRVIVVEVCVQDCSPAARAASLFDMGYKYADVKPPAEVLAALDEFECEVG